MRGHRPIKHYVQTGTGLGTFLTLTELPLAVGTSAGDAYSAIGYNVNAGSAVVTFMDINIEVGSYNHTNLSPDVWEDIAFYIGFNIANQQTMPSPFALNQSDIKNQIFWSGRIQLGKATVASTSPSTHSYRHWHIPLAIPKAFQTFNKDDHLSLFFQATENTATKQVNLNVIYKEFFQV